MCFSSSYDTRGLLLRKNVIESFSLVSGFLKECDINLVQSLMRTTMFSCDLPITLYPETHERFIQDYLDQFYHLFLDKLSLMEENGGVSEILINVLEIMPGWNRHLGFEDRVKMKCTRCKMNTLYPPPQPSFGILIIANSLRETKA